VRIALVNTRADAVGGSQVHVRDLAVELIRRGHDACVFVGGSGPVLDFMAAANVPYHSLDSMQRNVSLTRDISALKELKTAIAKYEPDLISTHTSKAGMLGRLVSRDLGIPSLFTAHGWNFADGIHPLIRAGRIALEKIAAGWCQRIITVSECDRELALRYRIAPPEKVITIHNGMPDLKSSFRADPSRSPVKIVMIARFEQQKDHETLLIALSALKHLPWELELIGDGPNAATIKARAVDLGVADRVQFPGAVTDVKDRLARAQLFALISNWEGLPRSIIEAMRAGLPVVASDVGGTRELIEEGRTGFLINRSDSKTLQERLAELLSNPRMRSVMGQSAREHYEKHFTFERMAEQTFQIYEQLVGTRVQSKRTPQPNRRRVVHVVESFAAGTASVVSELTCSMSDYQHVIVHGSRKDSVPPQRDLLGAGTTLIPWRNARREVRPLRDLLALLELVKLLHRQTRIDLIHAHSAKGGALARIAAVFLRMSGRTIYTTHCSPVLRQDVGPLGHWFFVAAEWLLSRIGGVVVACSESEFKQLDSLRIKCRVITNGVHPTPQRLPGRSNNSSKRISVGTVGRLVAQKDPGFMQQILDCAGDAARFEITWIGSGEMDDRLDPRVHRTGWLSEQRAAEEMAGFDVYLSTSRWEGLSLSVLNAMFMGKPMVLRRCVGNVDAVVEGENGYLFDDAAAAASRLNELAANQELRLAMGRRSREMALRLFTSSRMIEQYRGLYNAFARPVVPQFDPFEIALAPTLGRRILIVLEASAGGAGRHVLDLAKGLIDRGCEVHLLYASGRLDRMFAEGVLKIRGLKIRVLNLDRHLGIRDFLAVLETRRYVRDHGPFDIIHGHAAKGGAVARLAGLGSKAQIFYTPHGFQLMDPGLSRIKRVSYAGLEWLMSLNHRQLIVVSPEEQKSVMRLGISPKRVTLIPNGISTNTATASRAAAREAMNLSEDAVAVGFIGRLVKLKAVDVLLEAFAKASVSIPEARLVIVGSGPLRESLEALAGRLGISERVAWLGERDARELIRGFDIFTLASRKEGLPYVILEAMAAALPVVATESCSVSMLLKSGENGIVIPVDDADRFADALVKLGSDRELRNRMGAAAALHAGQFSIEDMVQRTLDAYGIAAEPGKSRQLKPADSLKPRRKAA